jgi:hypothetical protein
MGRFRTGVFWGMLAGTGIIAGSASNCAAPTQIIVEVRAESVLCSGANAIRQTGIAVTTPDRIDDEPLEIFEEGGNCDGDTIGRLTITPSGDKDAEVGIRIVAGVTKEAHQCQGPKWDGCILARRTARFRPNNTFVLTVYLSADCIGKGCGEKECDRGACVEREDIPPDGGLPQPKEDAQSPGSSDASDDAPVVEAGADACTVCTGIGLSCSAGSCTIDCDEISCRYKTLCTNGLDCTFKCNRAGSCEALKCATSGTCTFDCSGDACSDIQCAAAVCNVTCADAPLACNGVLVEGTTNDIKCLGNDKVTCDNVHCRGPRCTRTCGRNGVACGPSASCDGGCAGFQYAPPPNKDAGADTDAGE